jgi:23S rRNA (cytidine1920-2'-O)/16S rRNA (cytidine1409-2'-O)-methyltransferase
VRERLDTLLVARGLFATRSQARAAVLAGEISIGGRPADKPGSMVDDASEVVVAQRPRYVSRGGDKLSHALRVLSVDVSGEEVCDLGSSTGGFVDCLLAQGARRVIAVDVGYGILDYALRTDPRVIVLERTNARTLTAERLPFAPTFVTADVSFISLRLALGPVLECARVDYRGLVLVKPQFEASREQVGKGGVVRDPAVHLGVLVGIMSWLEQHGAAVLGACDSGHPGPGGNVEYFVYFCDARSPLAAGRADARATARRAVEGTHG